MFFHIKTARVQYLKILSPGFFLITASCAEVYFLLYLMSHPITISSINARMPGLPDRNDNYVWYIHPRLRHLLDNGAAFFLCPLNYFFCNFNTSSIGNPENLEISSVENLGFSNIDCAVSKACS